MQFEGFHCWPDAPPEVNFLRYPHRHIFHVTAVKAVQHGDRDIEFILLKRHIEASISEKLKSPEVNSWSCEHWAQWLIDTHDLESAVVSEDNENGAILSRIEQE